MMSIAPLPPEFDNLKYSVSFVVRKLPVWLANLAVIRWLGYLGLVTVVGPWFMASKAVQVARLNDMIIGAALFGAVVLIASSFTYAAGWIKSKTYAPSDWILEAQQGFYANRIGVVRAAANGYLGALSAHEVDPLAAAYVQGLLSMMDMNEKEMRTRALESFEVVVKSGRSFSPMLHVVHAQLLLISGKAKECIAEVERFVDQSRDVAYSVALLIAKAHRSHRQLNEAKMVLQAFEARFPNDKDVQESIAAELKELHTL